MKPSPSPAPMTGEIIDHFRKLGYDANDHSDVDYADPTRCVTALVFWAKMNPKGGSFAWALACIAQHVQTANATIEALTAKQEWDVEKVAEAMYNGGIYGVCQWRELAHDHPDRADFIKRAESVASQFTPPSQGQRTIETAPLPPRKAYASRMEATGERTCDVCGRSWTWIRRDGECGALWDAQRAKCQLPSHTAPPTASTPEAQHKETT